MVRFAPPSKPVTLAPATEQRQIKSELIHPMRRSAPRSPRSSRSTSRPTNASSGAPGGVGLATARHRLGRCRRLQRRGCSATRLTGSACGRASCSSAMPATARSSGSPRGCPTGGCRSRRGRSPTACSASCRRSSRWPTRSLRTRTRLPCAMLTRPAGAFRRCARPDGRAEPGSGPRSAAMRSTSTSIRAAVPRRRRSCSPRPSSTRSSSATVIAPTRSWSAFAGAR